MKRLMATRPIRQVIHGRKLVSAPPAMTVREAARLLQGGGVPGRCGVAF